MSTWVRCCVRQGTAKVHWRFTSWHWNWRPRTPRSTTAARWRWRIPTSSATPFRATSAASSSQLTWRTLTTTRLDLAPATQEIMSVRQNAGPDWQLRERVAEENSDKEQPSALAIMTSGPSASRRNRCRYPPTTDWDRVGSFASRQLSKMVYLGAVSRAAVSPQPSHTTPHGRHPHRPGARETRPRAV